MSGTKVYTTHGGVIKESIIVLSTCVCCCHNLMKFLYNLWITIFAKEYGVESDRITVRLGYGCLSVGCLSVILMRFHSP